MLPLALAVGGYAAYMLDSRGLWRLVSYRFPQLLARLLAWIFAQGTDTYSQRRECRGGSEADPSEALYGADRN